MRRRLFAILSALSLLLSIAVAALWVRSYRHGDTFTWAVSRGREGVISARGKLYVASVTSVRELHFDYPPGYHSMPADEQEASSLRPKSSFLGFSHIHINLFGAVIWQLCVPCWAVVALSLVLPSTWWAVRARRRRRERGDTGLCPACGYDLRATPGRCPECGRQIQPRTVEFPSHDGLRRV
jgi:hypothetical protein